MIDHHDSYTWNLVHLVAGVAGALPAVVEHDEISFEDLRDFSHIVLSPGPGHPDEPRDFSVGRRVLREAAVPVLGVCLGMQAMVSAYGGRVGQVEPAHGDVVPLAHDGTGIFAGLPQGFDVVRYHSLAALEVPESLTVTARFGDVVMGVAHREKPLWGVQFHPESILAEHGPEMVANFLALR